MELLLIGALAGLALGLVLSFISRRRAGRTAIRTQLVERLELVVNSSDPLNARMERELDASIRRASLRLGETTCHKRRK
jgi:hypothetical protein